MQDEALAEDISYGLHNLTEASITLLVRLLPASIMVHSHFSTIVLPFENALRIYYLFRGRVMPNSEMILVL